MTKSDKFFIGAILSSLNDVQLVMYSKDPNVPSICEILRFYTPNPHFNFQNFNKMVVTPVF